MTCPEEEAYVDMLRTTDLLSRGSTLESKISRDGKTHFRNASCDGDRFESTDESRFLHRGGFAW